MLFSPHITRYPRYRSWSVSPHFRISPCRGLFVVLSFIGCFIGCYGESGGKSGCERRYVVDADTGSFSEVNDCENRDVYDDVYNDVYNEESYDEDSRNEKSQKRRKRKIGELQDLKSQDTKSNSRNRQDTKSNSRNVHKNGGRNLQENGSSSTTTTSKKKATTKKATKKKSTKKKTTKKKKDPNNPKNKDIAKLEKDGSCGKNLEKVHSPTLQLESVFLV